MRDTKDYHERQLSRIYDKLIDQDIAVDDARRDVMDALERLSVAVRSRNAVRASLTRWLRERTAEQSRAA